jgi:hypothetical protein
LDTFVEVGHLVTIDVMETLCDEELRLDLTK